MLEILHYYQVRFHGYHSKRTMPVYFTESSYHFVCIGKAVLLLFEMSAKIRVLTDVLNLPITNLHTTNYWMFKSPSIPSNMYS